MASTGAADIPALVTVDSIKVDRMDDVGYTVPAVSNLLTSLNDRHRPRHFCLRDAQRDVSDGRRTLYEQAGHQVAALRSFT